MLWSFPEASCDGNDYTVVASMYPGTRLERVVYGEWRVGGGAGSVFVGIGGRWAVLFGNLKVSAMLW